MVDDAACIAEWRKLLKVFHLIIKDSPAAEKAKDELIALKEEVKVAKFLTFHQASAITERCDNYINGEYGNSKKPEHYSQDHNFSSNGKAETK